jgi:anhydro-N-acetylmuramic acid kinase
MSGTSADAIEVALARVNANTPPKLLAHTTRPFPSALRAEILRIAEGAPATAAQISQLNFRLGHALAEVALAALRQFRVAASRVALIGSHGQTIFHQGRPVPFLGHPTASTLQIGESAIIAARTGITTVADFRPADIAVGGQGAPLVPFADYLLYRHAKLGRVSLNLGGIANITVIPANATPAQVFAFDTGPANMLIDALVTHFTHGRRHFDKDALLARRGHINERLIRHLMKDPYLKLRPPKSTGREYFGASYVKNLLTFSRTHTIRPADLLYTATYFTAASIKDALHRFVLPKTKIDQLIVSGGGAQNPLMMLLLSVLLAVVDSHPPDSISSHRNAGRNAHRFQRIEVLPSSQLGIPEDAKEAYAFALLAYENWQLRTGNLPSATGATRPAILGKISYAPPR